MPEKVNLLFTGSNPTSIDSLILDCSITESHTGEVEVTDHPVEEGFNVSDHARPKPNTLTITGMISNTPIGLANPAGPTGATRKVVARDNGTDAGPPGFQIVTTNQEDHVRGTPGRAESALSVLRQIKDQGKVITVTTQIYVYTNMIMTNLAVPRDGKTGDVALFTASFKQIKIVKNKTTRKVQAKEPKAQPKAKAGKQTTGQANEAQKRKSIAYSGAEKLGLLEKIKAL